MPTNDPVTPLDLELHRRIAMIEAGDAAADCQRSSRLILVELAGWGLAAATGWIAMLVWIARA